MTFEEGSGTLAHSLGGGEVLNWGRATEESFLGCWSPKEG